MSSAKSSEPAALEMKEAAATYVIVVQRDGKRTVLGRSKSRKELEGRLVKLTSTFIQAPLSLPFRIWLGRVPDCYPGETESSEAWKLEEFGVTFGSV